MGSLGLHGVLRVSRSRAGRQRTRGRRGEFRTTARGAAAVRRRSTRHRHDRDSGRWGGPPSRSDDAHGAPPTRSSQPTCPHHAQHSSAFHACPAAQSSQRVPDGVILRTASRCVQCPEAVVGPSPMSGRWLICPHCAAGAARPIANADRSMHQGRRAPGAVPSRQNVKRSEHAGVPATRHRSRCMRSLLVAVRGGRAISRWYRT